MRALPNSKQLSYFNIVEENVGKIIRLKRIATSDKHGTFGVLLEVDREAGDVPFCVTLEPPLVLNKDGTTTPFLSSIPTGIYICRRVDSPRFSNTFEITEVPGRTHILFHVGNKFGPSKKETKGCVMVAEGFGPTGIERSADGFGEFMERLKDCKYFILQVTEEY